MDLSQLHNLIVPRYTFVPHMASPAVRKINLNRVAGLHFDVDFSDVHGHTFTGSGTISTSIKKYGTGGFTNGTLTASSSDFSVNAVSVRGWFRMPTGLPFATPTPIFTVGNVEINVQKQGGGQLIPRLIIPGNGGASALNFYLNEGQWCYVVFDIGPSTQANAGHPENYRDLNLYFDGSQTTATWNVLYSYLSGGNFTISCDADEVEYYVVSSGNVPVPNGPFLDEA